MVDVAGNFFFGARVLVKWGYWRRKPGKPRRFQEPMAEDPNLKEGKVGEGERIQSSLEGDTELGG